jgi:AcrR family transcriptional regulator
MADMVKRKRSYSSSHRREQAQMTRSRILDAARQQLARGTYSSVTIEDIAKAAGVSYQTVYSVFGTKLGLAEELIRVGFHFDGIDELVARLSQSTDPEVWLRGTAQISRRIQETCGDLLRFMRESGDPTLLARYRDHQELRLNQEGFLPAALERSGRLRPGISGHEVLAVIWALTGPDVYTMLVFDRGWTPSRYEEWLAAALIGMLLDPAGAQTKGPN